MILFRSLREVWFAPKKKDSRMTTEIITGDCREALKSLPAGSVHCCVTSPPYYNLRDYQVAGQIGMEPNPDAYIAELVAVFREVKRVLRDDATLWLNLGDSFSDKQLQMIPAQVALALRADGWILRSNIIWAKRNCMPESVRDRPTSAHEHVFLLAKHPRYYYDSEVIREEGARPREFHSETRGDRSESVAKGRSARQADGSTGFGTTGTRNSWNVWHIATKPFPEAHFATFPSELAERCILAGTSEKGCCAACGAPWVRLVSADSSLNATNERIADYDVPGIAKGKSADRVRRLDGKNYQRVRQGSNDWKPSCTCNSEVIPATVLDPFAGAFTAMLVAQQLGRKGIGIELNPDYCRIAERRITKAGFNFERKVL